MCVRQCVCTARARRGGIAHTYLQSHTHRQEHTHTHTHRHAEARHAHTLSRARTHTNTHTARVCVPPAPPPPLGTYLLTNAEDKSLVEWGLFSVFLQDLSSSHTQTHTHTYIRTHTHTNVCMYGKWEFVIPPAPPHTLEDLQRGSPLFLGLPPTHPPTHHRHLLIKASLPWPARPPTR